MAIADDNNGQWLTPTQAALPRPTIDARNRRTIDPSEAEVERRRHELVDDLRAARRWRVRWRDREGRWQVGGIPAHWWTHDAVNWVLGLLMHGDDLRWVQISDGDDQGAAEPAAPPAADQPAVAISEPEEVQRNVSEADLTGFLKMLPPKSTQTEMRNAARDHFTPRIIPVRLFTTAYKKLPDECKRRRGETNRTIARDDTTR
jgi:hypothetical protein